MRSRGKLQRLSHISQSLEKMKSLNQDLLCLDGIWMNKGQLLRMAMKAGSYAFAEHYLFALLIDAFQNGRREVLKEINDVRQHYHVDPLSLSDDFGNDDSEQDSVADKEAVKLFGKMPHEKKTETLSYSLLKLYDEHLFTQTRHWLAIYLVVRDRFYNGNLKQTAFLKLVNDITLGDLPGALRMDKNTTKNFGREICDADREKAYYLIKHNPQADLCDAFWGIIKETILTQK